MLSTKDLYKEIAEIEKYMETEKDPFRKWTLKSQVLTLKLLHSLRTNTVQVMEHFEVEKVQPKERKGTPEVK